MAFLVYDLILLGLFVLFVIFFLYTRRNNLKREGLLFIYRTKWGIKLIDRIGGKYRKTMKVLSYVSICLSYILMIMIVFLVIDSVYLYLTTSIAITIKAPPIAPLIPYFPQIFGMQSLFPPFYFIYFILSILIVATVHEFSHGIFARRYGIKIKSTGFGFFPSFLPVFLAAFVELDEKKMVKKSKFSQMSVLSAGVFANVLTAILFFIILGIFFSIAFAPAGVVFDTYSYSAVNISAITIVNGIALNASSYNNIINATNETGLNQIKAGNQSYLITKSDLESQKDNQGYIIAYDDAPAINSRLDSIILKVNGTKVTNMEMFREELSKYSPGDKITLETKGNETEEKTIVLEKNPANASLPFLGIAVVDRSSSSVINKMVSAILSFKKTNIYYEPKIGELSQFIYDLFWWIMIINLLVALMNMLPVGIFDGGRFFYLTVFGITKSEKIAKRAYKFSTYLFLFILLLLMIIWFWKII